MIAMALDECEMTGDERITPVAGALTRMPTAYLVGKLPMLRTKAL